MTISRTDPFTYHYDYRGSTIALSGDSGVPTDRMEYSLYGLTTYRTGTNDTPFLFNGEYGVQTDTNGLLYMRSRYYNPYLCRFINPDPSGFKGGLNFYAYANGNPVSYLDPFGLGALGESALTDPYFDAPTAEQTEIQNGLADFANLVTLGTADFASSAINGKDLKGNTLDFGDAFQQELSSGAFLGSLALALPTDGGSLEADAALTVGRTAAEATAGRSATTVGLTTYNVSFGSTGNALLDSVGIQDATISNIRITVDPSLTGADLANVTAHEGLHATIAQNFPNFAASSGRLPYIGAFPLYAEEVGAYGYGALSAGQYGQALLAPINAFGSMSAGQTISVLGTGAAAGGLWYYGHH